jgi:hypothetical protein
MPSPGKILRAWSTFLVLMTASALAGASSATLLLEEPYGAMGFFTATGHAAVYLSGVCAETPTVLRACAPGELGAVISRYDGVHGYDWLAVPLIPYLYAVDKPEDIPLFADPKMVVFLRDQYRRRHFEEVAPDLENGRAPGGNWYELVGSSYDRAAYGFEIETTAAQDEAFIRKYNAAPNVSHFHLSYRNCADFAKDVMNFYYPRTLHRSIVADVGITTPKQMAKTLIKFSSRHRELEFSRYVIPQVPGSAARSTPVHGVVESFLKSKKYIVPAVVINPVFAGCVVVVYEGTGAGRFDPAKKALVFNAKGGLETPLGAEDRRSYQSELNHLEMNHFELRHLLAETASEFNGSRGEKWARMLRNASPDFDADGRPILRVQVGEQVVSVGVAESNLFAFDSPALYAEELLETRLHAELRRGSGPKASGDAVTRDWNLLQQALHGSQAEVATGAGNRTAQGRAGGNQP